MIARSPSSGTTIDLRSELARDAPRLDGLGGSLPARAIRLTPGESDVDLVDLAGESLGVAVLDGLMLVELEAPPARIGWLVGVDDLVSRSAMRELALTERSRWRALTEVRLALLDGNFAARADGIPAVARTLLARAMRTSVWLLAKTLVESAPLVEERLLLMFALFGERWGRVTPEGVALTLPLTHSDLATLCGARRPSVTMALESLECDGLLGSPAKGTWLLRRTPSQAGCHPSCLPEYEHWLGLDSIDVTAERSDRPTT